MKKKASDSQETSDRNPWNLPPKQDIRIVGEEWFILVIIFLAGLSIGLYFCGSAYHSRQALKAVSSDLTNVSRLLDSNECRAWCR